MSLVLTLIVGFIGGLIGRGLRFPAPFMLGSMMSVALASVFFGNMLASDVFKLIAQIISGAYIGQNISRKDLKMLPKLSYIIISLLSLFTINMVIVGFLLMGIFGLDPATALLSCLPGGVMDVSLMSIDMGAKPDIVATLQTARFVGIMVILPAWVSYWTKRLGGQVDASLGGSKVDISSKKQSRSTTRLVSANNLAILLVSILGGMFGLWLDIPVGALIFSILFSSALKIKCNTQQLPKLFRHIAQLFAGSIIGTSFTHDSLSQMGHLILPIILLLGSYLVINICFGKWISKGGLLDVQSALFASSPAGATDISLLAGELGGDMPKIATIQICRILYTVVIMPLIVKAVLIFMM